MSIYNIKVQVAKLISGQVWATDPDMIEVTISEAFLKKARTCIEFMHINRINSMSIVSAFNYKLYALAESLKERLDENEIAKKEVFLGNDGLEYLEFTPEYQITGCGAVINENGEIRAVMPFGHSDDGDKLWCTLGNIDDLKSMFEVEPYRLKHSSAVEAPILRPRG